MFSISSSSAFAACGPIGYFSIYEKGSQSSIVIGGEKIKNLTAEQVKLILSTHGTYSSICVTKLGDGSIKINN